MLKRWRGCPTWTVECTDSTGGRRCDRRRQPAAALLRAAVQGACGRRRRVLPLAFAAIPNLEKDPGVAPTDDPILGINHELATGNEAIGPKKEPPAGWKPTGHRLTPKRRHYAWTVSYSQLGSTPPITAPATSTPTPSVIWSPSPPCTTRTVSDIDARHCGPRLLVRCAVAHICLVGALALVLLLAAGCGGASKTPAVASLGATTAATPSSGGSRRSASPKTIALEFANCMRSHGVPSFPDPGGPIVPGIKQLPEFRPAMAECNSLYPSSGSTGVPLTEAQRTAALAQARCIRDHGVPNFPDPTFPTSGGELFPAIAGFDPNSPAFTHAAASCGLRGSVGQPRGG